MKTNQRRVSVNRENSVPTAHVTVNKNRVKQYQIEGTADNNTSSTGAVYYLQDGQTFEIELFNPTKSKVKADITLDGNLISAGGLVIKPGERVYLERFVDSDNKFVFETYEVEDSEEVNEAISDNGKLEVKFYDEYFQLWRYPTNWTTGPSFPPPSTTNPWWPNTTTIQYYNTNVGTTFTTTDNITHTNTSGTGTYSLDNERSLTSTTETGRTEKGEASSQTFDTDNSTFFPYATTTVEYKLLPVSQQPITKKDLNVKRYCTECGAKTKAKFKFCPSCGDKL